MDTTGAGEIMTINRRRDILIVMAVIIALLLPFSGKAFHIDDTLFVWAARHLTQKTFPFYWFNINWYGYDMPMFQVMKNPPLTSYFIAVTAPLVGWSERALHFVFLLPAVSLGVAIYLIAERFTRLPLIATLAGIITPVFLVSGTTVMSDVLMLDLWCWAVYLWIIGIEKKQLYLMLLAGAFIVLATLTKYFAMSLIPLLGAYSLYKRDRLLLWLPGLILASVLLAGYQLLTKEVYGRGLLLDAATYAANIGPTLVGNKLEKVFTGLDYAGGCLVTVLFYGAFIWKKKTLVFWGLLFIICIPFIAHTAALQKLIYYSKEGNVDWGYMAQVSLFVVAGLSLIVLAVSDFIITREAGSLLLLLWILGTFTFAAFINWTNNGRSNLPMLPAAGILIARALERRYRGNGLFKSWRLLIPLAPALVLALFVSYADYAFANSARDVAVELNQKYISRGERVWYQGHWGFQYYMDSFGARPFDRNAPRLEEGDIVVRSYNNSNISNMPEKLFNITLIEVIDRPLPPYISVMSFRPRAAGFYSSVFGAIPYALGHTGTDRYGVMRLRSRKFTGLPGAPYGP